MYSWNLSDSPRYIILVNWFHRAKFSGLLNFWWWIHCGRCVVCRLYRNFFKVGHVQCCRKFLVITVINHNFGWFHPYSLNIRNQPVLRQVSTVVTFVHFWGYVVLGSAALLLLSKNNQKIKIPWWFIFCHPVNHLILHNAAHRGLKIRHTIFRYFGGGGRFFVNMTSLWYGHWKWAKNWSFFLFRVYKFPGSYNCQYLCYKLRENRGKATSGMTSSQ